MRIETQKEVTPTVFWRETLLILGLIMLNAFFAASEIAVISAKPVRVRQLAEDGNRAAAILLRLMDDPSRFLATIQVGITLAGFLASATAAVGMSQALGGWLQVRGLPIAMAQTLGVLGVTFLISYVTLVLGELTPKRMALQGAEGIALMAARPIDLLSRLTGPFTRLLTFSTNLVVRLLGGKTQHLEQGVSEEEIRLYVAEHQTMAEEEKRLIEGIFDFGDQVVRQVMIPRPDMVCLAADLTVRQALEEGITHGHLRFPVYQEDYDEIIGLTTIKDLAGLLLQGNTDRTLREVMRAVSFVPETKPTIELLKEMQNDGCHLAVVVDEYGGTAGLVTLDDLVEEIVGEVAPGPDEEEIQQLSPTEMLVDGATAVADVSESINLELPESSDYETLAGFMLAQLGHIPKEGEVLLWQEVQFEVVRMEGYRIDLVRIIKPTPAEVSPEAQS